MAESNGEQQGTQNPEQNPTPETGTEPTTPETGGEQTTPETPERSLVELKQEASEHMQAGLERFKQEFNEAAEQSPQIRALIERAEQRFQQYQDKLAAITEEGGAEAVERNKQEAGVWQTVDHVLGRLEQKPDKSTEEQWVLDAVKGVVHDDSFNPETGKHDITYKNEAGEDVAYQEGVPVDRLIPVLEQQITEAQAQVTTNSENLDITQNAEQVLQRQELSHLKERYNHYLQELGGDENNDDAVKDAWYKVIQEQVDQDKWGGNTQALRAVENKVREWDNITDTSQSLDPKQMGWAMHRLYGEQQGLLPDTERVQQLQQELAILQNPDNTQTYWQEQFGPDVDMNNLSEEQKAKYDERVKIEAHIISEGAHPRSEEQATPEDNWKAAEKELQERTVLKPTPDVEPVPATTPEPGKPDLSQEHVKELREFLKAYKKKQEVYTQARQKYQQFRGVTGVFRRLRRKKYKEIEQKLQTAYEEYKEARALYIGEKGNRYMNEKKALAQKQAQERMDQLEGKKKEGVDYSKDLKGMRTVQKWADKTREFMEYLGEKNVYNSLSDEKKKALEVLAVDSGWTKFSKGAKKFVLKNLSLRRGVQVALLGGGMLTAGAGYATLAAGASVLRRGMAAIPLAPGTYDFLSSNRLTSKEYRKTKDMTKGDIENLSTEDLLNRMEYIEAKVMWDGSDVGNKKQFDLKEQKEALANKLGKSVDELTEEEIKQGMIFIAPPETKGMNSTYTMMRQEFLRRHRTQEGKEHLIPEDERAALEQKQKIEQSISELAKRWFGTEKATKADIEKLTGKILRGRNWRRLSAVLITGTYLGAKEIIDFFGDEDAPEGKLPEGKYPPQETQPGTDPTTPPDTEPLLPEGEYPPETVEVPKEVVKTNIWNSIERTIANQVGQMGDKSAYYELVKEALAKGGEDISQITDWNSIDLDKYSLGTTMTDKLKDILRASLEAGNTEYLDADPATVQQLFDFDNLDVHNMTKEQLEAVDWNKLLANNVDAVRKAMDINDNPLADQHILNHNAALDKLAKAGMIDDWDTADALAEKFEKFGGSIDEFKEYLAQHAADAAANTAEAVANAGDAAEATQAVAEGSSEAAQETVRAHMQNLGFENFEVDAVGVGDDGYVEHFSGSYKGMGVDYSAEDGMSIKELASLSDRAVEIRNYLEQFAGQHPGFGMSLEDYSIDTTGSINGLDINLPGGIDDAVEISFKGDPPLAHAVINADLARGGLSESFIKAVQSLEGVDITDAGAADKMSALAHEYNVQRTYYNVVRNLTEQGNTDLLKEYLESKPGAQIYTDVVEQAGGAVEVEVPDVATPEPEAGVVEETSSAEGGEQPVAATGEEADVAGDNPEEPHIFEETEQVEEPVKPLTAPEAEQRQTPSFVIEEEATGRVKEISDHLAENWREGKYPDVDSFLQAVEQQLNDGPLDGNQKELFSKFYEQHGNALVNGHADASFGAEASLQDLIEQQLGDQPLETPDNVTPMPPAEAAPEASGLPESLLDNKAEIANSLAQEAKVSGSDDLLMQIRVQQFGISMENLKSLFTALQQPDVMDKLESILENNPGAREVIEDIYQRKIQEGMKLSPGEQSLLEYLQAGGAAMAKVS